MKESLINKLNILKNSFSIKENLNKNFKNIYLKIAELIFLKKTSLRKPLIIGLAGGQGSGKTTFAQFLKLILENRYNLRTVTVSIDDIYKTKKDRIKIIKSPNLWSVDAELLFNKKYKFLFCHVYHFYV